MPVFLSSYPNPEYVTHAFIVIHGRLRDGGKYWSFLNSTVEAAQKDNYPGSHINVTIAAPQFFSARYNKGQYGENELAWGDVNAWQALETAVHPTGTSVDAAEALDAIVEHFEDKQKYPSMTNITLVGHGGGGQLMQRYAAVGKSFKQDIHIRYIHGDPSSCVYFTADRPEIQGQELPSKEECPDYDTWRYGFVKYPKAADTMAYKQDAFQTYITRDVISLVGEDDVNEGGDQTCMAKMQGGKKRRDRNLIWWRYINTLAGTRENLTGFPGSFQLSETWSDLSNGSIRLQLGVVKGIGHDAADVFASDIGRSALFSNGHINIGWRPEG